MSSKGIRTSKRNSSLSHLSLIGKDNAAAIGCGRLFRADYLSTRGKWIHLGKLLTVMFIPILGGWTFTLYSLADNIVEKGTTVEAQTLMLRAISLGRLIYTIQKERDMSILYISKIGPSTKAFLIDEYDKTDKTFADMWSWPLEFTDHANKYFRSKTMLINHINSQRNKLDPNTPDVYGQITFYSEIVEFFMDWMIERIRESGFGNIWKSLVVFQKITRCMLDTGAERAYGAMFFAQGNFPDLDLYDNYFRRIFRFNYNYKSATFLSDLVDPLFEAKTDQRSYTIAIRSLRAEIKNSNFSGNYVSKEKAEFYFDNSTFRVDYLYILQEAVAMRVIRRINSTVDAYTENIIIYSVTASLVIIACPFIMAFAEQLTSNMQEYSKVLVKASDELNNERSKTDSLLYQMLPRPIAERLKRKSAVESEFFKSATVMFTSVVDFVQLSIEYSPMELIDLLNILYSSIDDKIDMYDVYKVETINDTYMVVSGVPTSNGNRHASEIAYLALDIASSVKYKTLISMNTKHPLHLMIGISTGSVSAGVVGNVMLRYCLFGDTVNTASRMKSHGHPDKIHISESTFRNLSKTGSFTLLPRGKIVVKGKGEMNTYWLIDSTRRRQESTVDHNLPGEVEFLPETSSTELGGKAQSTSRDPRFDRRMKKNSTSTVNQFAMKKVSVSSTKKSITSDLGGEWNQF
ncbi:receptor-type guanylate cyclase daf-11-like [Ruditapes philippinarum]|uniref:receptor-type guanylate cyclase daf-11-like n=1 Tax=Ruditapes philippinarum TaxID=129788 RepID=UPI00295A93A8|nr:receptor-type guanylate cyclase daf-11-like [Ruditapes philippinarum]